MDRVLKWLRPLALVAAVLVSCPWYTSAVQIVGGDDVPNCDTVMLDTHNCPGANCNSLRSDCEGCGTGRKELHCISLEDNCTEKFGSACSGARHSSDDDCIENDCPAA
jgi:hypothetical protein